MKMALYILDGLNSKISMYIYKKAATVTAITTGHYNTHCGHRTGQIRGWGQQATSKPLPPACLPLITPPNPNRGGAGQPNS